MGLIMLLRYKRNVLELVVFIGGASVMIFELLGSRMIAPYFGTSLAVWTSLIGVVLASLSVGYSWGGKLADRRADYKMLSAIVFMAGALIGLVAFVQTMILMFLQQVTSDVRIGAVIGSILLLAPPSVLLGMISPYAVKLKVNSLNTSGSTVGNLYAISTIGSIVGTFGAGFFLIAYFGTASLLFMLSLLLIITSLMIFPSSLSKSKVSLAVLLLASLWSGAYFKNPEILVDVDTLYNRAFIQEATHAATGRPMRILLTEPTEWQSAMFLDRDDDLVFEYTKYYRLADHFNPDIKKALLVGGGAYSYPKDFLAKHPQARLDVVEIDSRLTDIAREYFNLKDDPRMAIYHEDGRTFLNKNNSQYDAIFMDAFKSFFSVPYQLTTKEAAELMYNSLSDDGVVLMNIISSIEGQTGEFLRAEYATYASVFPNVYILPTSSPTDRLTVRNLMLVALKSPRQVIWESGDPELNRYLQNRWVRTIERDMPILTDDYAPVDQYIMKML
ncbi:MAG: Spermidine synthase [bacterium ADurb.Bin400]|nr:MAG: Spermidine synthase [bacterium ADurb.Bin400]